MRKDFTKWFEYHVGDMAHLMQYCDLEAEAIVHRLMRAYYRRQEDIPTDDESLALTARTDVDTIRKVRRQIETAFDLSGPVLRIPVLDSYLARVTDISRKRSESANRRWHPEGNDDEK